MTPEQALQILDNIARVANMNREAHGLAQTAVEVLTRAVAAVGALAAAEAGQK